MMDVSLTAYIHAKKKFSLHLLIQAFSRLCLIQLNQGYLTNEDILQCVQFASQQSSPEMLHAHASLIHEGAIVPSTLSASNPTPVMKISSNLLGNEGSFIRSLLEVMYSHNDGAASAATIEMFQAEAVGFLKQLSINHVQNQQSKSPVEPNFRSYHRASPETTPMSGQGSPAAMFMDQRLPKRDHFAVNHHTARAFPLSSNMIHSRRNAGPAISSSDYDLERTDAVSRLLAQVRKNGMDILFPQVTQDMILATILISVQTATIPIHREIIDMIVALKDSNMFPGLESVSKTKIRGVLALLKHSELLLTEGNEGEPVRLYFPGFIQHFHDLRKAHDQFLVKYMLENNVYIPNSIKEKIFWYHDETMLPPVESIERQMYDQNLQHKIDRMIHVTDMMKEFLRTSFHSRNENDPQYAGLTLSFKALQVASTAEKPFLKNSSPVGSVKDDSISNEAGKSSNGGIIQFPPGLLNAQPLPNATDGLKRPERGLDETLTLNDLPGLKTSSPTISADGSYNNPPLPSQTLAPLGALIIEPPTAGYSSMNSRTNRSSGPPSPALSSILTSSPHAQGHSALIYDALLSANNVSGRPSNPGSYHQGGRGGAYTHQSRGSPLHTQRGSYHQNHNPPTDELKFSSYQTHSAHPNNYPRSHSGVGVPGRGSYGDNFQHYPPRSNSSPSQKNLSSHSNSYNSYGQPIFHQQKQQPQWKDFQSTQLPNPPQRGIYSNSSFAGLNTATVAPLSQNNYPPQSSFQSSFSSLQDNWENEISSRQNFSPSNHLFTNATSTTPTNLLATQNFPNFGRNNNNFYESNNNNSWQN